MKLGCSCEFLLAITLQAFNTLIKNLVMKILIFKLFISSLSFMMLLPHLAFADRPDRDLLVQSARDFFSDAQKPSTVDLQEGRYWTCSHFSALPGDDGVSNAVRFNALRFVREGSQWSDVGRLKLSSFHFSLDGSFISESSDNLAVVKFLRGALIVELSKEAGPDNLKWYPSVSSSNHKVFAYLYCLLSHYQKGDYKAFNSPKGWN